MKAKQFVLLFLFTTLFAGGVTKTVFAQYEQNRMAFSAKLDIKSLLAKLDSTEASFSMVDVLAIPEEVRSAVSAESAPEEINEFFKQRMKSVSSVRPTGGEDWDGIAANLKNEPYIVAKALRALVNKDAQKLASYAAKRNDFRILKLQGNVCFTDMCDRFQETPGIVCEEAMKTRLLDYGMIEPEISYKKVTDTDYKQALTAFADTYNRALFQQRTFPYMRKCTLADKK